jgi:hypothetical protein
MEEGKMKTLLGWEQKFLSLASHFRLKSKVTATSFINLALPLPDPPYFDYKFNELMYYRFLLDAAS